MKNKYFKNRKIAYVVLLLLAIVLAISLFIPTLKAYAAYSGQSSGMTRNQLHSETLATSVGNDTPAITVLMHGLGGRAMDWSNNFNGTKGSRTAFVQDLDSIIEKMRNTSTSGINLYRAETTNTSSFKLYSEYSNNEVSTITDFSLHTVIVVEINTWMEMENVYERLHYVIDKISYDYCIANDCLPRINLIGHSMGGLLNMQYAIAHPKNVASLVSLGSPYNGSWYDNWFVEQIGITSFANQPCITCTCEHDYYFCDLETRKNTWNSVYSQNTHIKFYALSGETSAGLIDHIVYTNNYLEDYAEMSAAAAVGVRTLVANMPILNIAGGLLPGDVCVDTDSQKAVGYDGVINYNKVFTSLNCNVNKRSQDNFPIPHNLEVYDNDMHNCILRMIDYGNDTQYNSYTQNGINASIVAKSDGKWLIQLTNYTGSARSFDYNQKMCFESDAQNWSELGYVASTNVLTNGASTIIEISENGTATSIVISYDSGSIRYIFYANALNDEAYTMTSNGSTKSYYSYTRNGMKVGIISKHNSKWLIKLTNNTGSEHDFYFNAKMCLESDAKNWTGLSDINRTVKLKNGESTIIEIEENGTATSIVMCYISGSVRNIFFANNLSTAGTLTSSSSSRTYYSYNQNGIKASIIGKNSDTWLIELTNNTGSSRCFNYNQKMCFENDGKNWNALSDIVTTISIANGESTIIEIVENGTATSIAISYTNGSARYIFYAKNLDESGSMNCYNNTTSIYSYTQNGMKVGIVGKNGSTWLIELTNNTGSTKSFYYNEKMCSEGDAQNWTGLSDITQIETLANSESTILEIQENGTSTSIAISYISGSTRYVFYAKDLDAAGTLTSFGSSKSYYSYTKNGMKVSIVGKSGNIWLIELTNNTGKDKTFVYNSKMCFEGDAKDWTGLSDTKNIYLANGATTSEPIKISENGTATSIAISYMDGDYRKIFYAYNLNESGTMVANENEIDTTAPPSEECVAAGTLITLADGSKKAVEELTGSEMLLVWNLHTGTFDTAPILFIDSELIGHYEVIELTFSDGTTVDVISEHGFWDVELNKYVYLDENAAEYIGHSFMKQDESGMTQVILMDVEISTEVTTAYSPVTYGHLCYYVNGMLSMPGGIDGIFNIFEVDEQTMKYDKEAMQSDINTYGLFTYEEFNALYNVPEVVFEACDGQYLKVAIGKGLITHDEIVELIEKYAGYIAV